jgi:tetratricopeptide (TPR) repeat protein
MRYIYYFLLLLIPLFSQEEAQIKTLYYSLKQNSIKEQLAFYSLFPDSIYGKKSFKQALDLINQHRKIPVDPAILKNWPEISISAMIQSIGRKMNSSLDLMKEDDVSLVKQLSSHLKHHQLKGHLATSFEELPTLPNEEIDLARSIFLYQFQNDLKKVEAYEAALDLMTLEILAKVPKNHTIKEILHAMHDLIFFEMEFRFPPHSLWAKEVDTFTFLPSVMDDRFGVCLGVSILYISIGQRLGIPFNIFTPPGHIFIQAQLDDESLVNIETTARGIHIPMDHYLGINTLYLDKRTVKETVALALMNFAAIFWEKNKYEEALDIYTKAEAFMPNDPLLHYFMTLNALFCGKKEIATKTYEIFLKNKVQDSIKEQTLLEDYFNHQVNLDGLKTIFTTVDETRNSILDKQKELLAILKKHPKFREGHFHLGITYLQLSNYAKAKEAFEQYHLLDSTNPTVEYYLAHLCMNRLDYKKANDHLNRLENLMKNHNKSLKIIKPIRLEIMKVLCAD